MCPTCTLAKNGQCILPLCCPCTSRNCSTVRHRHINRHPWLQQLGQGCTLTQLIRARDFFSSLAKLLQLIQLPKLHFGSNGSRSAAIISSNDMNGQCQAIAGCEWHFARKPPPCANQNSLHRSERKLAKAPHGHCWLCCRLNPRGGWI